MLIDKADALLAGLGGNHHDDAQVVFVGNRFHLFEIIFERKVWNDCTRGTTLHARLAEALDAVVHNHVEISHHHKGNLHLILDSLQL